MAIRLLHVRTVRFSIAAAAVAGLAVAATATATAASPSAPSTDQPASGSAGRQAQANTKLVEYFSDQLFNDFNLSVVGKYVSPDYLQHNPTVGNGPAALEQFVTGVHAQYPKLKFTTIRAVAEGDLVFLQNQNVVAPGATPLDDFDVYRVDNGKIVEHWDVLESQPSSSANGNSYASELSKPESDYAPASVTAQDKGLVLDYLTEVTQDHEPSAIGQYVAPSLYQHDPTLANGSAAIEQSYASLLAQNPYYGVQIAQVAAEGDLVAVHAHVRDTPSALGQSVVYLFRVRDGKIVEEWDSTENVPATSANDNTMF
ncbi:nuclear transport factor 2 family protein [Actinospica sp.]|jgi:predicted SnoaL-like aldol condensation-catalyzing enzyme|uniref:nuclear transport factor 2 family protein n=1 Tax=Actinospica sp. TaxID=1872142 RepID=UPI002C07B0C7|nr:nuclear transport factor 2 family protein [Actinospica sp.]HWG26093.1 nuclear transport factor 2 family protein [Actinospica sp.]